MLAIDLVSDVICPWCFIGARRLDQAMAADPSVPAKVTFHPFLLDPSIPPEGADLRERLRAKYGVDPERMFGRVEAAARESGIPLDFSKVKRTPNTLLAHALLARAIEKGTQPELARALFEAYFLEGKDIGEPGALTDVASPHGFERGEIATIANDAQALARARAEAAASAARGITGVPFFVFGGRVAVHGAQPVEVLRGAIQKASA